MSGCCAFGCSNRSPKYKLFRIPNGKSDQVRRHIWISRINRKGQLPKGARLCEEHFDPSQFERKIPGKLKPNAVPTIFSYNAKPNHRKTTKRQRTNSDTNLNTDCTDNTYTTNTEQPISAFLQTSASSGIEMPQKENIIIVKLSDILRHQYNQISLGSMPVEQGQILNSTPHEQGQILNSRPHEQGQILNSRPLEEGQILLNSKSHDQDQVLDSRPHEQCQMPLDSKPCEYNQILLSSGNNIHLEALSKAFLKLLNESSNYDVNITCKGKLFKAHRIILETRSSVFAAMFKNNIVEGKTRSIKINDINVSIFQSFLQYLYSGTLPDLTIATAKELYMIGDKYNVKELKIGCSQFLIAKLSAVTAWEILILADEYNDSVFRNTVISYIVQSKIPKFDKHWSDFCKSHPALAMEVQNRYIQQY